MRDDSNIYTFSVDNNTRLRRVESGRQFTKGGKFVYTKAKFGGSPLSVLNSAGQLDITNSNLTKFGSVPPSVNDSGFAATATTTSIHWYWDATNGSTRILQRRADNTKQAIPKGDLNVTGLIANTKYYFYPFWSVSAQQVGWALGTVGSPKVAFTALSADALQQQNLQDREQLSAGAMSYTTPAAGTSSGSAGDGGATGRCVKKGTRIEPLYGEMQTSEHSQHEWMHIETANGCYLDAVPKHRIYTNRGLLQLDQIDFGYLAVTKRGESAIVAIEPYIEDATKVSFLVPDGELAWTNDVLSHNGKII